jgi:succinoglycan biosynthesis transport protein ExoP
MELRRYLLLLRRRLILIVLCVVAGAVGGYVVSTHSPTYQAQTSLLVSSRQADSESSDQIIQLDTIIATYAALVKSTPVAQGAIKAAQAPRSAAQVVGEIKSVVVPNTNLIDVTVTDPNAAVAQALADGVDQSFIAQVQDLNSASGPAIGSAPSVTVSQSASLPEAPLPTSKKRNVALGAMFGLVVSVAVVLLLDYLDITVRNADDLERDSGLPVLGVIPLGHSGNLTPLRS